MKRRIIIISLIVLSFAASLIWAYVPAPKPYTFTAHTVIQSAQVNANFDALFNWANGGIISNNLATGAVTNTKLGAGSVTDAKMSCTGDWATLSGCGGVVNADALHYHDFSAATGTISAAQHGDLSAATSTMHIAQSVKIANAGLYFATTTTEVEQALTDLVLFTGFASGVATSSVISIEVASTTILFHDFPRIIAHGQTYIPMVIAYVRGFDTGTGSYSEWSALPISSANTLTTFSVDDTNIIFHMLNLGTTEATGAACASWFLAIPANHIAPAIYGWDYVEFKYIILSAGI